MRGMFEIVEDTVKECERYEGSRQHQLRERQETNNGYWWQHGIGVNIFFVYCFNTAVVAV